MHARAAGAVRSIGQISDPAAFARAEAGAIAPQGVDAPEKCACTQRAAGAVRSIGQISDPAAFARA